MKRQGFTLVEVLVVLGIIAVLLSIVMPALKFVKKQANAVNCSSNIKQLLMLMTCYTENNNGTLPIGFKISLKEPPEGRAGAHSFDRLGWWWFNYIGPLYGKNDKRKNILECPSKKLLGENMKFNLLCGNYGVNQSICRFFSERRETEFLGLPLKLNEINQPDKTLLLIDSGYALINWCQAADEPPEEIGSNRIEDTSYVPGLKINSKRDLWPQQQNDALFGRHPKKQVNVGFVDGHNEYIKADDVLVKKQEEKYTNRKFLWTPNDRNYN